MQTEFADRMTLILGLESPECPSEHKEILSEILSQMIEATCSLCDNVGHPTELCHLLVIGSPKHYDNDSDR